LFKASDKTNLFIDLYFQPLDFRTGLLLPGLRRLGKLADITHDPVLYFSPNKTGNYHMQVVLRASLEYKFLIAMKPNGQRV
jgi:hypothetical protein